MVGQEHVLRALINALDHNRLHHAYLFTGTRGVGKTTIARILAKCLNCETGVSSEPCGQCSSCREIAEGRFVDLIEVDAASRTRVEDTRELLDNVQYAPTRGRYKIYLIDEVHMLSTHSFNALLKTLEEPPEHVKFLLATTDPQKLPVTILSRCLQFNLKNMSPERIVSHLQFVLGKELVPFEESALWQLARSADGSMRDALSLTDQAIAFGGGKISDPDVITMLGTIDQRLIEKLVRALIKNSGVDLLSAVAEFAEHAPDYYGALGDLILFLHRLAITQAMPEALDNSYGDRAIILELCQLLPPEDVQLFYQTALIGRRDLHLSPDPRAGMEMVLLRMLAFKPQGVADVPSVALTAEPASESVKTAAPSKQEQGAELIPQSEDYPPWELSTQQHSPPEHSQNVPEATAPQQDVMRAEAADPAKKSLEALFKAPGLENLKPASQITAPIKKATAQTNSNESASLTLEPAATAPTNPDEITPQHWLAIYLALGVKGVLQSTVANCLLISCANRELFFLLDQTKGALFDESHRQRFNDLLNDYFDAPVKIYIDVAALSPDMITPAMAAENKRQQALAHAINRLNQEPLVHDLQAQLGAVLNVATVKVL
jgi:DNA polymerase-3 subunit gamma/tau